MDNRMITSETIFELVMRAVAPLPCQKEYLKNLASILSFHIHRNQLMDEGYLVDDLPSMSAIVVASTGQGKTFLLRKMTEVIGVNLITVDCSTLAAEGWKGVGLAQRLLQAQKESKDPHRFACSILFLDEVDKLRLWGTNSDQGNPMNNILQLYNSGSITAEGSGKDTVSIDVSRFTVILGGAFEGLTTIISKRLVPNRGIGFNRAAEEHVGSSVAEYLLQVTMEDLIAYGMLPELLGRVGTILTIPPLTSEDYRQLLWGEKGSIECQYRNYLSGLYGVSFSITEAAVDNIAQLCIDSNSGARAVTPAINVHMRRALAIVEQDVTINTVVLDAKDEELFVRYGHGIRRYCYLNGIDAELPIHRLRGKSVAVIANKLCRYYRKAGGDLTVIPVLQSFLECTLEYLTKNAMEKEIGYSSLEKLARSVHINSPISKFEMLMGNCNMKSFERFCELYTISTQRDIVMALQRIMDYLESYYGRIYLQIVIKKRIKKQGGK